ncbi:T-cell immunoglobulin and mucin domain-containing protein 4-like isoform X2 [Oryzias latipes]|uniref:T-cell immunoglobulin and mucin domain-containing protein 4-like isoform X2 n=1 Tax=Oryzias latipes TaxID=8090 RepID=UPI0009DA5EEE|nr:T-cell immunoglobulin and mucin domain-containing protein 4-like isoform X2 [Oryzias latipes]
MKILVLLLVLLTVSECEKNVTGRTGQSITLPCKYDIKINGPTEVCWGRGPLPSSGCTNQLLATDGHKVIKESRASSRYQLQGRLDEGDVSLTIMNVTEEDTGLYGCKVEIVGWFNDEKHPVHLTVNRAPRLISTPSSGTTSSSSDIHQTTAATPTSGDFMVPTGSDVTDGNNTDLVITPVQENSLHFFIGNTLRFSFIIFIPLLVSALFYRVWRSNLRFPTNTRPDQPEEGMMILCEEE